MIAAYGRKLLSTGLVRGTWGNISVRRGDLVCITPSGMDYEKLRAGDIAVVDLSSGRQICGEKASSELPLHLALYRYRRIGAVIHTHSQALSALSVLHQPVPPLTEDQAMIIGGDIPCTEYMQCGTVELADKAAELFESRNGVILANHGYAGGGRDIQEAFANCMIAEKSAAVYLDALAAGLEIYPLDPEECIELKEKYSQYRK